MSWMQKAAREAVGRNAYDSSRSSKPKGNILVGSREYLRILEVKPSVAE
jgi:hypothetical protein